MENKATFILTTLIELWADQQGQVIESLSLRNANNEEVSIYVNGSRIYDDSSNKLVC